MRDAADSYQHFNVAIYARVYKVQQKADLDWLKARFEVMSRDWRGQSTGEIGRMGFIRFEAAVHPHSFRVFRLEK